jgi:PAS domain S-box-containing protein
VRDAHPPARGLALADVIERLPVPAAAFDRDLRYLAHSEEWAAAHGLEPGSSLRGESHFDVFPELADAWREVQRRCLEGATLRRELDGLRDRSGGVRSVRWVVTPWGEVGDDRGGLLVFAENLTDQVATRRRLVEREDLIRQLFEQSPVGLNLCRLDGLWLESNPAFLDIIGYSAAEADGGLTYWQLTPRSYDAEEAVQLEALRAKKRYGPYEKEFIRKDGSLVPVRLNGFIVERDGVEYIWSLIEDLTAQRALQAKLEEERIKAIQSSKLAVLGEMAAGIAHEVNNPLSIIAANAFLIRDALEQGDVGAALEAVAGIEDATTRAGRIVRSLRKFSRRGGDDLSEILDVADLVSEALELCRVRIRTTTVDVESRVTTTRRVRGHSVELSQVLVNLLNNAFDAAGGSEARWVRITASDEGETGVIIAVEDSGPRIPPRVAAHLFHAFYTTKKPGEGTGLGLSISKSIVEAHGGTLTYDAEAPHTRFVVRLEATPCPR